jgi:hypothetical protein
VDARDELGRRQAGALPRNVFARSLSRFPPLQKRLFHARHRRECPVAILTALTFTCTLALLLCCSATHRLHHPLTGACRHLRLGVRTLAADGPRRDRCAARRERRRCRYDYRTLCV